MESKVNYALVGLFVIVLSAAFVGGVLWLAGGASDKLYDTYRVYFRESVAGLVPKAAVRYRGVDVGEVTSIRLDQADPRRVDLLLKIERGTPIREDTVATLSFQGLTGYATIELSSGSPVSPMLQIKPNETWPEIKSAPSLVKRLDDAFTDASASFNSISRRLEQLLNDDSQHALGATLANLQTISAAVANRADSIDAALADVAQTLHNSAQASVELNALVARLGKSAVAVEAMAKSIIATSDNLRIAVTDSRKDLQKLTGRTASDLNALLQELDRLTGNVERFVQGLQSNPQMLILGKPASRRGPGE